MSRLRVALVGCGLVGQTEHAFFISANSNLFEFAALVDASATVREGVGERYGVPVRVASLDELDPGTLDAIVCATPDVYHSDVVLWALEHGLHVLCEKPLAFTLARVRRDDRGTRQGRQDRAGRLHEAPRSRVPAHARAPAGRCLDDQVHLHRGQRSQLGPVHRTSSDGEGLRCVARTSCRQPATGGRPSRRGHGPRRGPGGRVDCLPERVPVVAGARHQHAPRHPRARRPSGAGSTRRCVDLRRR